MPPVETMRTWLAAVNGYKSIEVNTPGFRHVLGIPSFLAALGIGVPDLTLAGVALAAALWWRRDRVHHADVLGMPVHLPAEGEACVLGSALVAAVHAGLFETFDEAARAMVRIAEVIEPNPANRQTYEDAYARYLATYPALKPLMHGLK